MQEQSLTRAGWGKGMEGGEAQGGETGERAGVGGGQYLSNAKRDVAHVETSGLSGHLAPNHRHWRWGHSQTIRSHGREKGSGWNLTRSLHGLVLHWGDVLKARRWHVPVFTHLLLLLMAGRTNQSTVLLFSASGQRFASSSPIPRGTALVPVAPISAPAPALSISASRATVTTLPVPILLVPLLFILVELPLELVEVRHA